MLRARSTASPMTSRWSNAIGRSPPSTWSTGIQRAALRVAAGGGQGEVRHQREVADRDDPHPRVAARSPVRAQLLQVQPVPREAGLLAQLPSGGRVQALVPLDEAAG